MSRLFLTNKDVQKVIGKGQSAAQRMINLIKKKYARPKFDNITVVDFSNHTGLSVELILKVLEE
ncbi:hypothetical protein ACXZ1K_00995 [Pedobacter sp. PWIIR3]